MARKKKFNRKAFLKIVIPLAVLVAGAVVAAALLLQRQDVADSAVHAQVMLAQAINDSVRDAPVDLKTADTYFPALRLYVQPSADG